MDKTVSKKYFNTTNRIHPQKFALWTAMASITMMFGAFTSAYIVRRAAGNWLEFSLPDIFFISTLVLLVSSLTLHSSYKSYLAHHWTRYRAYLMLSVVLGLVFVVLQYQGWMQLFSVGIDLKGNPSGSFLYMITGVHALHVIGGIAALIITLINAFSLKLVVTERRKTNFELTLQYWHFVGILWVYLLVFLFLSR